MTKNSKSPSFDHLPLGRITKANYSANEVIGQFELLLAHVDLVPIISILGISKFRVRLRAKAISELKAISIAFWFLALESSFPSEAQKFFQKFCQESDLTKNEKEGRRFQARINVYKELMMHKKETDFEPVASYLTYILGLSPDKPKAQGLKLSLKLRELYMYIFNNLV